MTVKIMALQVSSRTKKVVGTFGVAIGIAMIAPFTSETSMLMAQTQDLRVPGRLIFSPSTEQPSSMLAVQQHSGGDAIVWMPDGHTLQLKAKSSGPAGDRVSVTSGGTIGIGTTAPRGKLDVRGDLYVDGAVYINGKRVALGSCE